MSLSSGPTSELPKIQVLAGFGATSAMFPWTDISAYARSGSITRAATRLAGPLYQYQAGTLTLQLKNGDARFDPDNLSGPYVTTQGLQSVTKILTASDLTGNSGNSGNGAGGTSVMGSFTVPANLVGTTINVQCWAAGAGGGTGSNITQAAAGGGGGAGEFASEQALQVTAGNTYGFTLGEGGAGGTPGSSTGTAGGDTTYAGDSVTVHAHGGLGGGHGSATGSGGSTGQTQGLGGLGGSGSLNSNSSPGGAGGAGGQNTNGTAASGGGGGGSGGSGGQGGGFSFEGAPGQPGGTGDGVHATPGGLPVSGGGPGGNGGAPKADGSAPSGPPGGGGGGGSGEENGGNGADGQIVISYAVSAPASARTEVLPEVPIRVIGAYAHNQTVSFENGTGTWLPLNGATLAADTTNSLWGQTSLMITPPGGVAGPGAQSELILIGPPAPGGALPPISASIWAFIPSTAIPNSVKLDVNFYSANQVFISNASGTPATLQPGVWTLLTNFANVPPSNAVFFELLFKINGTPLATSVVWVDQAVGAPGPAAQAFPLFTGYADSWTDAGLINPNDPLGAQTGFFQGYAETALQATDAFEAFSLANLPTLSAPLNSGDDAGQFINVILSAIGWPAAQRLIDTSPILVQGSDYGDTALDLMQVAQQTDGGDLFMDALGNVVFFTRNHVLSAPASTSVQAVFGDRPGTVEPNGTELPYAAAVRVSDNTTLYNDVQITPVSGIDPLVPASSTEEATDEASVALFLFVRSYQNQGTIQLSQSDAMDLAQWILFIAKDSEDRIDQLTLQPQRDPGDVYYQALGRQFTDEIEFWRRPAGMMTPVVKRLGIRGIAHTWDFSAKTWQTVWTLQDYTKYNSFLRLDDINSGRLGYNALAF